MTAPARPSDVEYAAVEIATVPLGRDAHLVYSPGGSPQVLPAVLSAALARCVTFATLDQHVRACARELGLGADQMGGLRDGLARLVDAGLLASRGDLLRHLPSPTAVEEPPRIGTLGLVTRDRPASLERAVASYLENVAHHGRAVDVVVLDDSDDGVVREETRQMLADLGRRHGAILLYAGEEEKRGFAQALAAEAGVPADAVDFALFDVEGCGRKNGGNVNALVLHAAGDLMVTTDDDTVCQLARAPEGDDTLAFSSANDPTDVWFFPDGEAARGAVTFEDRDILAIHEALLGRTIPGCLAASRAADPPELTGASSTFLRSLASGRGRVVATMNGKVGDSGINSSRWYLTREGGTRERLISSPASYRSALTSREIIRAVPRPTISTAPFCSLLFLGLDTRGPLPPFFPVLRGADSVFGATVRSGLPSSYIGHVPWLLRHAPLERRVFTSADGPAGAGEVSMSRVVLTAIASWHPGPGIGDDGLPALGRHLTDLGTMPPEDFEEFLRLERCRRASEYIARVEELLQRYDETPDYWANDVRKVAAVLRGALTEPLHVVPVDLLGSRGPAEARALSQRLVRRFGDLVQAWPEITAAARRLRARGHRLARPLDR